MTWNVYVHGNQVSCHRNTPFSRTDKLSTESLQSLISVVDGATVCPKNPKRSLFIIMVTAQKGVLKSTGGKQIAAFDDAFQVSLNDEVYQQTIRTTNCGLVHGAKCQACTYTLSISS